MKKQYLIVLSLCGLLFAGCNAKTEEAKDESKTTDSGSVAVVEKTAPEEDTCVYDSGSSGVLEVISYTLDEEKNIQEITIKKDAKLAEYLFEEKTIEELTELYSKEYKNPKSEQKGMTFDISVDEEEKMLHVNVTIDANEVTLEDMELLGFKEYATKDELMNKLVSKGYDCK